ncbi:MAG: cobalt transporter CbiM [Deltaproteobacteria bacterium]|jgi:cobalt/nickel transport system permease protein|nr:cobalt transporter CbiM [Deltaproteobacteria bacterium]
MEGALSLPVLVAGGLLTATGVAIGLTKVNNDNIPKVAVMTAAFFTASFIHINIGPSTVHLMLNGLIGLMMGWVAFPIVLIGLLIQALLFQYGGLTTLGVNTLNVAGPAVLFGWLFNKMIFSPKAWPSSLGAFATGFLAIALTAIMVFVALILTDPVKYKVAAYTILVSHVPVMFIEGIIALLCVRFLRKVKPELLINPLGIRKNPQKPLEAPLEPKTAPNSQDNQEIH